MYIIVDIVYTDSHHPMRFPLFLTPDMNLGALVWWKPWPLPGKHPQISLSYVRAGDALPPRTIWRAERWNDDYSPSRPCGAGLWYTVGLGNKQLRPLQDTTVLWFPSGTLHYVSFLVPYDNVVFQCFPTSVYWRVFCWDVMYAGCTPLAGTTRALRCGRWVGEPWICRYNMI